MFPRASISRHGSQAHLAPSTATGERIFAIGDVHGRLDLLDDLIERIQGRQADDLLVRRERIVFLGDVVDRGPESAACLERVASLVDGGKAELILGNHEIYMIRAARGDGEARELWLHYGGDTTLESLRVEPKTSDESDIDFGKRLTKAFSEPVKRLLKRSKLMTRSGDYAFVHAGVRPGRSLAAQDPEDLHSIRGDFTLSTDWHGAVIVHGHTIVDGVEIHPNRIAVDTGAFRTNTLSAIELYGAVKRMHSVTGQGSAVDQDDIGEDSRQDALPG